MNGPEWLEVAVQIGVLLIFMLALTYVNRHSGSRWLSIVTLVLLCASIVGAGYLIVEWVFL